MNLLVLLTVTAVADWTYDGFVADPADPPAASVPKIDVPAPPPPLSKPEPEGSSPKGESKTIATPPATTSPTPPTLPKRWRLADSSGQVWEFRDPERLKSWVAAKNAELRAAAASSPILNAEPGDFRSAPGCASGQCPTGP